MNFHYYIRIIILVLGRKVKPCRLAQLTPVNYRSMSEQRFTITAAINPSLCVIVILPSGFTLNHVVILFSRLAHSLFASVVTSLVHPEHT